MPLGFGEFELPVEQVIREKLPEFIEGLPPAPLDLEHVNQLPEGAQGAYILYLNDERVYVGKTDVKSGFRSRLKKHWGNIRHRRNLNSNNVTFRCARIPVFAIADIERILIDKFRDDGERPEWNFSGIGSNDPGRNRDGQDVADFDWNYPIDPDVSLDTVNAGDHRVLELLLAVKYELPYDFRYQRDENPPGSGKFVHYRKGHEDFRQTTVTIPADNPTVRDVLDRTVAEMPGAWQATILHGRIILYKEHEDYPYYQDVIRK